MRRKTKSTLFFEIEDSVLFVCPKKFSVLNTRQSGCFDFKMNANVSVWKAAL